MENTMTPALTEIDLPDLPKIKSGKVREVFDIGDAFLFVATDRISAFDCILPDGIPSKGSVLTQMSAWWFEQTKHIVPHHMITSSLDDYPDALREYDELIKGRSMLVKKADPLPIECVVRGYLIGSGWKEYQTNSHVCGIKLREGYQMADRLDQPIFTPATKATDGHDENISFERAVEIVGRDVAERVRDISLKLYQYAFEYARERGIIIADTKFEFGLIDGQIVLIDEALTPDSSRFWPASSYAPGQSPPSFDKQFVRDYLESLDWDKNPPAPSLPQDVLTKSRDKYLEAFRLLTGKELE